MSQRMDPVLFLAMLIVNVSVTNNDKRYNDEKLVKASYEGRNIYFIPSSLKIFF